MTLYKLIEQISEILTPDTMLFYDYVLHTSDDNGGFLRTRYCWWEKTVEDFILGEKEYKKVMISMKRPFDIEDLADKKGTLVKMQIDYCETDATLENADWDAELGYCYIYIFDLQNKTYTMNYIKCPYV